ncbi:hypothetical protein DICPUDRAFT_37287 [Dictyostelium purpureum]|uniref:RNA polymerase II subunit B1 CTD phosphatase RPAP2 homolog n=1 Tax=Dictyostelium purpureum TaxID=5786 RepID=F0ZSL5_DICPU|nr:uncharacterized protein DICPUDRAFT_37287 [Dictyostelium purpureum]EGC33054.1 hypothetical protein DICPUDRAFT_37287 [Dictyostelium purpureum]|eukprot:XP_003290404.1 hypothetical protein DICPUDRAFT_37287 [Dictyostelium purpureum]
MENTLQTPPTIEKPKIRVIKKVIKKRPPANPNTITSNKSTSATATTGLKSDIDKSNDIDNLNNKITGLKIKESNSSNDTIEIKKDEHGNSVIKNKPQVVSKSEILKKTIKEKVYFDKLTFDSQMFLIENETTEDQLKNHYYNYLQDSHFKDIVVERSTSLKCGYPCCGKSIDSKKILNQKYKISIKEQKVYNVEELSMFCSSDCLIKSKLFESTLDSTAVYLRKVNGTSKQPTTPSNNADANKNKDADKVFNSFEKSLKITENENASLQPPSSVFADKKKEIKETEIKAAPSPTTTATTTTINHNITTDTKVEKKKIKIIDPNNIPLVNKIKDTSDDDGDSSIDNEDFSDQDEFEEENPGEIDSDSEDEENDEDLESKSDITAESSDDEFSLFRPSSLSTKKYQDLYKPSNYHSIYSALSQFITKHTNIFIKTNQVNYEYILEQNMDIKSSLHTQLNLIYPSVLEQLNFKRTTGKDKVIMLLDTFKFDKQIPSLKRNHWKMMILVFLKVLSKNDKDLEQDIKDKFEEFTNLVIECGFEFDTLKVFEDLLTFGYE